MAIPFVTETAIMQGGNLLGGYMAAEESKKARQAQEAHIAAQLRNQKEFAQHGVRWKVEDSIRAGIHPLAGLGAQTHGYQTIQADFQPDHSMSTMARNMSQDISRAVASQQTASEQNMNKLMLANAKADLDGKVIDNQIRATQLQKLQAPGTSPGLPGASEAFIPGQRQSGLIKTNPLERTASAKGSPYAEAGAVTDAGWAYSSTGALIPVPSGDVKQRIEDNIFQESSHFFRNNVLPNFGSGPKPPKSALPKGATDWRWSYSQQGYVPKYRGDNVSYGPKKWGPAIEWFRERR